MGQVHENVGYGRYVDGRDGNGNPRLVIGAWAGCRDTDFHDCFIAGDWSTALVSAYASLVATAYNSGRAAWLTASGSAFGTWFAALPNDEYRDLLFAAAYDAGANGRGP